MALTGQTAPYGALRHRSGWVGSRRACLDRQRGSSRWPWRPSPPRRRACRATTRPTKGDQHDRPRQTDRS